MPLPPRYANPNNSSGNLPFLTPSSQTSTVPQNAPGAYRTVGVCGAPESGFDNHNQLIYQGGFNVGGRAISFAEYSDINDINVCCKKCYHSPEWSVFSKRPPLDLHR